MTTETKDQEQVKKSIQSWTNRTAEKVTYQAVCPSCREEWNTLFVCNFWDEKGRYKTDSLCLTCAETVRGLDYASTMFPINDYENVIQNVFTKWRYHPGVFWDTGRVDDEGNSIRERVPQWEYLYGIIKYGTGDGIMVIGGKRNGIKLFWIESKKFISKEPNIFQAWFRARKDILNPESPALNQPDPNHPEVKTKKKTGKAMAPEFWQHL